MVIALWFLQALSEMYLVALNSINPDNHISPRTESSTFAKALGLFFDFCSIVKINY